jgi:Ca-activated chloride channel family protein
MAMDYAASRARFRRPRASRHLFATFHRPLARARPARAPRARAQWRCPIKLPGGQGDDAVQDKAMQPTRRLEDAIGDLAELVARAFFGGLAAAVALSLAILALSATAQAAALNDTKAGTLLLRTGAAGDYAVAPQVSTEVAIDVTAMVARTRVTQIFHNPGSEFVEGVYVFPLPEKAAVDRLWMKIGERVIEGRIREKEDARREYQKAKQEGRKAALVEQQRPNLFTNAVAHIGPNDFIEVRIEYQQALAYENGTYRLRFPLAVTPRYVPMGAAPDALPDEPKTVQAAAPGEPQEPLVQPDYAPPGRGLLNPVDIAVSIDAGVALAAVVSSYHEAVIEKRAGGTTLVSLVKEQEDADRDFELSWTLAGGTAPQAAMFTQQRGETEYALLMVVPPQPTAAERAAFERMPRETILVVDTSGSMQGTSIEQAKQALEHALDTLTARDRFNLLEFNSVTRPMLPFAVPATPDSIARARQWVRALRAGGGTEMDPALRFALAGADTPGYLRQVIFITDGAVGNEDALFRLIAERLGSSRLFTVGIGSAPNSHFMTKAAQFGRGTFTYIGDVREVHEKMTQLFAKIEAPVLRDVAIRWPDGTPVETFPARVPDLYLGEPVLVAAAARAPLGTVVVTGLRGNQPWSVALTPPPDRNAAGVGALWARAKISTLMDELRRGAEPAQIRPQVVAVALEHHLVSAFTSMVAVDLTPTAAPGDTKSAMVNASLPQGWAAGATLPQTDTAATLQLLLGLGALLAAAGIALLAQFTGRRA